MEEKKKLPAGVSKMEITTQQLDMKEEKKSPAGRPSNDSRLTSSEIERGVRKIVSDITRGLQKDIAQMTIKEKTDLLGKLLPYVLKEDNNKGDEVTMEQIVNKYVDKKLKSSNK
ncbi:MAG: hypothetical protein J6V13_03900 [Paludibacteraceae bacterium]|nr:hypothetical protein [Paludibacteraceae bacterium]